MDYGVVRELGKAYCAVSTEQIRKVLGKIVEHYDAKEQEGGFIILREPLKWLQNEPFLDQAVNEYFQDIRRIMCRDSMENKNRLKQAFQEAVKRLPKFFNLDTPDYMSLVSLIQMGQRKLLSKA